MDDDWEAVADSEVVIKPKPINVNKWEGEDDDEDVKESWEDEEEKKDEEKSETKETVPVKTKPNNKALKAKQELEARLAEEEEAKRYADMTPEEKLAEKLRLQKIQEEADLKSALETFGVNSIGDGLDSFDPHSKEEFKEFGATLSWKINQYKESAHFPLFIEDLVRNLCLNLSSADLKKVKICVEALHSEKLKIEKANSKKSAAKNKSKATLRTEADDIDGYKKYGNDFAEDDYDDFM